MLAHIRRSVIVSVFFLLLFGLAYPLVETGMAQALFPHQASGSLGANGSTLIGQVWAGPRWFHGRPDADNPMATGASNLGPRSKVLEQDVARLIAMWHRLGVSPTAGLVTTSGSGVDPDISPAAAYAQVPMVARARGLSQATVRRLVAAHVHGAQFGFLGAPYVNVLELNQALARLR